MPPKKRLKRGSDSESAKKTKTEKTVNSESGNILEEIQSSRINCAPSVKEFKFNKKRVRILSSCTEVPSDCHGVVYWMSRDERVQDNWAFLYAQRLALKFECPLYCCFCLVPSFLEATIRQYRFLLKGLEEVEKECLSLQIPFILLQGEACEVLSEFVQKTQVGAVVTDFSPVRIISKWSDDLKMKLPTNVPICQVDAHNIVPCWIASDKLEYGARTIRKKIHDKMPEFLTEFPPLVEHPFSSEQEFQPVNWKESDSRLQIDRTIKEVEWAIPGSKAALLKLEEFCQVRLKDFDKYRNDPTKDSLSNLSPWMHFGQIAPQRCILQVLKYKNKFATSVNAFVEEAVVRRELADNFCFYNANYDAIEGAYDWAKHTLQDHAKDKREYIYDRKTLEEAKTHDPLWNSSQKQMVLEGKMHGFLRMYWAKKILEWTTSPEEALATAIFLNDRYELDGRDPNGYVACGPFVGSMTKVGWRDLYLERFDT